MSLDIDLVSDDCEHCGRGGDQLFTANITHNLGKMAAAAGIYDCLWQPEEHGIERAEQLIAPLRAGIGMMVSDPRRYREHDAPNGWGTYEDFLPWLGRLLKACEQHPLAKVRVSR